MRNRITYWIFGLLFTGLFSCNKELSREMGTVPVNGDFYATVNGVRWDADSLQLVFRSDGGVSINGLSNTGEQISMFVETFKTGSYTLNAGSASYAYYTNILIIPPVGYLSNAGTASGTIIISAIDSVNHLITGSFNLTLVDPVSNNSKTITQGVFNFIPYSGSVVVVPPPPPSGGLDTLNAKIDGVDFVGERIDKQTDNPVFPGQLLIVGSSTDASQRLEIIMPEDVQPGNYPMDYNGNTYIGIYFPPEAAALITQANGTLVIISNDTAKREIIGTFSFTASPLYNGTPAEISDGYFHVSY